MEKNLQEMVRGMGLTGSVSAGFVFGLEKGCRDAISVTLMLFMLFS